MANNEQKPQVDPFDAFFTGGEDPIDDLSIKNNEDEEKGESKSDKKENEVKSESKSENSVEVKQKVENTKEEDSLETVSIPTGELEDLGDVIDELKTMSDNITDASRKEYKEYLDVIKDLVAEGKILPFEGKEDITQYSKRELKELLDANIENIKEQVANQFNDFIEGLPDEIKEVLEYYLEGGEDIRVVLKLLSEKKDFESLDPSNELDAEIIVRTYLKNKLGYSDDEIDEEIDLYKKAGKLSDKAEKFNDTLKKEYEETINKKKEEEKKKKEEVMKMYNNFVSGLKKTLSNSAINGIEVPKEVRKTIETGLTEFNYKSITGRDVNLLGHLLEKYQYIEPNYGILAEAVWLLQDPEGYKKALMQLGAKEATEETIKKLKVTSQKGLSGGDAEIADNSNDKKVLKRRELGGGGKNYVNLFRRSR